MLSLFLGIATIAMVNTSKAQVSVNINIGSQPEWGPSGYNYAEYYIVLALLFLASRFLLTTFVAHVNGSDKNKRRIAIVGYNEVGIRLEKYFNEHKVKYARYKNYNNHQVIIKNKHDNGNHNGQYKKNGNGKGNNKGKGKGHGKGDD